MKKGLLLINLGTPSTSDVAAVRKFLQEFLADKRVIDLPTPLRYLLLYGIILPFRPKKTAQAYQAIWSKDGSPLLINSQNLLAKLQYKLQDRCQVALGMRYGQPSIAAGLQQLSGCDHITILPLFPQYSSAATGSAIEKVLNLIAFKKTHPSIHIIRDFFQHSGFIAALAAIIKPYLDQHEHLLLSYHGIPERHLHAGGCITVCQHACPEISAANSSCYKAQCYQTSRHLTRALDLTENQYTTAFQSRLGRTPWITPYTDKMLPLLANKGIKRLAVSCPSFTADCLETLEEIGMRAKAQWLKLGGETLTLIPCVNDSDLWVDAVINLTKID